MGLSSDVLAAPAEKLSSLEKRFYPVYPKTSPAVGVKAEQIKRGEYLAKMGDCIACHSNVPEGKAAYAGGLPLVTPFGTFYSPNITPDKDTGIGNWSEQDFIRALKEGRNPDGANYFPVFPYIYFSKTTDDDARALYAYFMSIPAVKQKNIPLPFPFNMPGARLSLWGWNTMFFFPNNTPIVYDKTQTEQWNRGKYIVDGLGHCSMCHTPLNLAGAPQQKHYLTGAFIDGYWAPNIGKDGLETASVEEVAQVFNGDLINQAGPVAGPMAEVNHDSLSYLTKEDQLAIATYIKTVDIKDSHSLPPSDAAPNLSRGKQVYQKACTICHQSGEMSAPLLGDSYNWYNRLKTSGLSGIYRHGVYGLNSMPYKGACVTCSEKDVIAAIDYMLNTSLTRSQWIDFKKGGATKFPTPAIEDTAEQK